MYNTVSDRYLSGLGESEEGPVRVYRISREIVQPRSPVH